METLTELLDLIIILSVASERLVEITKAFVPFLNKNESSSISPGRERIRRALIHALAVLSGILTAFISKDYLPVTISESTNGLAILGLGLLASGGSSFWNSILSYVNKVKDITRIEPQK